MAIDLADHVVEAAFLTVRLPQFIHSEVCDAHSYNQVLCFWGDVFRHPQIHF